MIPLAAAKVRFATPDGKSEDRDMASEMPLYTPAVTHSPTNIGTGRIDARATWTRGDVQFIGRGVPHESKNAGDKPIDFVMVAIK